MEILKKLEGKNVMIKSEQIADLKTKSKIITITRNASGSNKDVVYTGVGFKPSSLQAIMTVPNTIYHSVGFSDEDKVCGAVFQSSSTGYNVNASYCIVHSDQSSWVQGAKVKSYDEDGFTLTWTKVGTPVAGTLTAKIICYR